MSTFGSRSMILLASATVCLGGLVGLSGCEGDIGTEGPVDVDIPFVGVVGDDVFACGTSYDGLGSANASAQATDFRVYIHDLAVIDGDGVEHPVTLRDTDFQADGHVLLDFEDGTGACDTGSPARNTVALGSIDEDVEIAGVAFTVGVKDELNHLDVSTAAAPFNIPGMYWSWAGGYKYLKADLLVGADEAVARFHQGASTCSGTPEDGFACADNNQPRFSLDLDPEADAISFDLAAFYAGVDLAAAPVEGDGVKGCMSGPTDPECPAMFGSLGIDFAGNTAPAATAVLTRVGAHDAAHQQGE